MIMIFSFKAFSNYKKALCEVQDIICKQSLQLKYKNESIKPQNNRVWGKC